MKVKNSIQSSLPLLKTYNINDSVSSNTFPNTVKVFQCNLSSYIEEMIEKWSIWSSVRINGRVRSYSAELKYLALHTIV